MNSRVRQIIYLLLALAGLVATWYFNIKFSGLYGGFSLAQFIGDSYTTYASSSMSSDVIIAAVVFLIWSYQDAKKIGMRFWWVYFALTFIIALAFSFPFYLFMRERHVGKQAKQAA